MVSFILLRILPDHHEEKAARKDTHSKRSASGAEGCVRSANNHDARKIELIEFMAMALTDLQR